MVAAQQLALVVRQRGGNNLILHTRGIPGRVAGRACEEAVTVMGKFAALRGRGDTVNGDNPPTFGFDKLLVAHGRGKYAAKKPMPKTTVDVLSKYIVVYRLVNKVWVMAVSPWDGDVFVGIRVVESATKGLVTACQSMEITAEIISKHYAEAYMMMGAVLGYQGTSFGKAQVVALANLYTMGMDEKTLKKVKSAKSIKDVHERKNTVLVSNLKEKMRFPMPGGPERQIEEHPGFPKSSKPPQAQIPIATKEANPDDDFFDFSKLEEQRQKDALSAQSPGNGQDPFLQVPGILAAGGNNMANNLLGPSPVTTDDDAFWASLGVPQSGLSPPVEPHQPLVRSDKPQFTLLHVEHWRAKFSGSKAIESSVLGEVATCPKALPMRTRFQLKPPSNCPQGLEHSLRSSSVKKGIANGGGKGIFEGDASVGSVLLRYKLWPGSFLEPVVFRLSTGRLYEGKENDRVIVLLIEFAASSDLVGSASGFVDVHVPYKIGSPTSARPKPQWSKQQSRLRWPLSLEPGSQGIFRALFPPETGLDTLSALSMEGDSQGPGFKAEVHLVGKSGTSLSEVSLLQNTGLGQELREASGSSIWKACLHLQD